MIIMKEISKAEKKEKTNNERDKKKIKKEKKEKAKEKVTEKKGRSVLTKARSKISKMPDIKLFGKWDSNFEINEPGLKRYITLKPKFIPKSSGAFRKRFHKSKMHIVERLALHLLVPGHKGKKHRLTSGKFSGGYENVLKIVEKTLDIIEKKENKNPVEVLTRAIENAAAREEIISYQLGSIVAREAVITSPQRRIDKTLRYFAQSAYRKSFKSKRKLENALAEEIILASQNSDKSEAIKEKIRIEHEASGAR